MITIDDKGRAWLRLPWPTNDTGPNNSVLKAMASAVAKRLRNEGHAIVGGVRFDNIERTETGYEFVFSAQLTAQAA
jgi:hypothetical protein